MIKKIIIVLFCSFMFMHLFSLSMSQEEAMNKAKEYEQTEDWIYALGTYYDANLMTQFDALAKVIKSGIPGTSEISIFDESEKWANIVINYEKYFSENIPYEFYYLDPIIGKIDYENKTAECGIPYKFVVSKKFKLIKDIVESGYWAAKNNNRNNDWFDVTYEYGSALRVQNKNLYTMDLYESILVSFFQLDENKEYSFADSKKRKEMFETFIDKNVEFYDDLITGIESAYQKDGIPLFIGSSDESIFKTVAWNSFYGLDIKKYTSSIFLLAEPWKMPPGVPEFKNTMYEIQLSLCDQDGNIIQEGESQFLDATTWINPQRWYYTEKSRIGYVFSGLDENAIKLVKDGKCLIKLNKIKLNYGCIIVSGEEILPFLYEIQFPKEDLKFIKLSPDEVIE